MAFKMLAINDFEPPGIDARTTVEEDKFEELIESIKHNGIIEPIIARDLGEGKYEVIAGARRLLAAKAAGLGKVPAIVNKYSDDQVDAIKLHENIIREDLNHVDIARYIEKIIMKYNLTQEEVAKRLGKTSAWVSQMLSLLRTDPVIRDMVETGELSYTIAREINRIPNEATRRRLAYHAKRSGCNSVTVKQWVNRELADMNKRAESFVPPETSPTPPEEVIKPVIPTHPCQSCGRVGDINAMWIFRLCPDCGKLLEDVIRQGVFNEDRNEGYSESGDVPDDASAGDAAGDTETSC